MTTATLQTQHCSCCHADKPIEQFPLMKANGNTRYKTCCECRGRQVKLALGKRREHLGVVRWDEPLPTIPAGSELLPCPHHPGSSLKAAWIAARYQAGLPLFDPRDAVRDDFEESDETGDEIEDDEF